MNTERVHSVPKYAKTATRIKFRLQTGRDVTHVNVMNLAIELMVRVKNITLATALNMMKVPITLFNVNLLDIIVLKAANGLVVLPHLNLFSLFNGN